jgi:hypothetical protein
MRVTTKLVLGWDGRVLEHDFYEWDGPVELACGVPAGQQALATAQTNFYNQMTQQSTQEFAQAQAISQQLQQEFSPIFALGPNQYGYSKAEDVALSTEITDTTAAATRASIMASRTQQAGEGGGNGYTPQGANAALTAGINTAGTLQAAQQETAKTVAGYNQGFQNWELAAQGLETAMNPYGAATSTAGTTNQAGSAANQTETDIAEESSSWMGLVSAGLGAAATLGSAGIRGSGKSSNNG